MTNTIIAEIRAVREKLDKELAEKPVSTKKRWMEIEKKYSSKIVHRQPKLLKSKAA
jgi:hypothetical protein